MSAATLSGVLLVCGGRTYADRAKAYDRLDRAAERMSVVAVRQGGASGADQLAAEWAFDRSVKVQTFRANWETHGRGAGHRRNVEMLADGAVVACVAFPGGAGTENMIRLCRAAGIPTWRISS